MLETLIIWGGCVYILYKFVKAREIKMLCVVFLLLTLQISRWPLHLPFAYALAGICFIGAAYFGYENRSKPKWGLSPCFAILLLSGAMWLALVLIPSFASNLTQFGKPL